jgi:hypothetical protein
MKTNQLILFREIIFVSIIQNAYITVWAECGIPVAGNAGGSHNYHCALKGYRYDTGAVGEMVKKVNQRLTTLVTKSSSRLHGFFP